MKNHHPEVLVKWDNSQLQETKTLRNWKTKSEQKTILNQQYHWRKSKKHKDCFHARRPGQKQYRRCGSCHTTRNGNTIHIHQATKNKIRNRSDRSKNLINLLKHSFSSNIFILLNKNLSCMPYTKKVQQKTNTCWCQKFYLSYQTPSSLQGYQNEVHCGSNKSTI